MPNRQLTQDELEKANALLARVRSELDALSNGEPELLFAYRRKIAKELVYDERRKPMQRRALKKKMRALQGGLCARCREPLPESYAVLDRFNASDSYVDTNVQLLCEPCDRTVQRERRYK